jgi:hypothetical protein
MEWINNHDRIKGYLDARYKVDRPEYVPKHTDYPGATQAMEDWANAYLATDEELDRPKSLILWGPTRNAKTAWARYIGWKHGKRAAYMQAMFNLDNIDNDVDYVVLDDITPKYLTNYKCWLGAQTDFNCTDKYRRKTQLKGNWPCIMCMNEDPREVTEWDQAWIAANCVIVHIDHFLGRPEPVHLRVAELEAEQDARGEQAGAPIVYLEDLE